MANRKWMFTKVIASINLSDLCISSASFSNTTGSSACLSCLAGYFCAGPGVVSPPACPQGNGDFLDTLSIYNSYVVFVVIIYSGAYCVANSSLPTLCPLSTFSNSFNLQRISDCSVCSAGRYAYLALLIFGCSCGTV